MGRISLRMLPCWRFPYPFDIRSSGLWIEEAGVLANAIDVTNIVACVFDVLHQVGDYVGVLVSHVVLLANVRPQVVEQWCPDREGVLGSAVVAPLPVGVSGDMQLPSPNTDGLELSALIVLLVPKPGCRLVRSLLTNHLPLNLPDESPGLRLFQNDTV